jgi:uncharacterized membrane protein
MARPDLKIRTINFEGKAQIRLRHAPLADIFWIIVIGSILIGLIFIVGINPALSPYLSLIRVSYALVFVLFIPGYLFQCVLFPHQEDLDGIERVGLSLTLSVALVSIMGLVLNWLPWGFSLWSIVVGQTILIILLMLIVVLLRFISPVGQVFAPQMTLQPQVWWSTLRKTERRLITSLVAALLLAGLGTTWIIAAPSDADFMTEFYILGAGGMAEDYPRSTVVNEPVSVTAGVDNLEREPAIYWIIVKLDDRSIEVADPFSLEVGETWQGQLTFTFPKVGDNQRVDILLGREDHAFPYRSLSLWLDVEPNL